MFASGVNENIFLLSMRSDKLFTDESEYKENYISVANQRDAYEKANYPNGVWIVRLEGPDVPPTTAIVSGETRTVYRWTLGRFRSAEAARKFVASRTSPEEVPARYYSKICDCLSWKHMMDYKQCKGIVFEQCRTCGNPKKEIFREPLNKLVTDDFDLDEFLGL